MNLYVFIAIALGAITGYSEPRVAPRALAGIVNECDRVTESRAAESSGRVVLLTPAPPAAAPRQEAQQHPTEVPLTGAATPRAPAANC